MLKTVVFLCIITSAFFLRAQQSMVDSAITIPFIGISYSINRPGSDLGNRFGLIQSIGGQFGIKLKSNVYMAFKVDYLFGDEVKEAEILDIIRTSEGGVIEIGGQLTNPILDMEGYSITVMGGYVFPLFGPNPNSGLLVSGGLTYLQHHIQIDYRDAQIPQLEGDYIKGYDRLTSGFGLNEFVGYIHYGKRKLINFYLGMDFTQTITKNRRGYNYDQGQFDNELRKDNLMGFRLGWVLTLYKRAPEQFYYN